LKREKTKKVLEGEQLLCCWMILSHQIPFVLGSEKLMCVMVCKTIYKICLKQVQRMRKMKFFGKEGRPITTNNMCTSSNAIQMDDGQTVAAIGLKFWFYHPQPCIFIWFSSNCRIPMNESAWVMHILKCKSKEEKNMFNCHALHPRELWISLNKYGVIMWLLGKH